MIIVGLTGGIGSGKSYVANIFKNKNIPIYNSDTRAKELMITSSIIKNELINKFGSDVYINKKLNKKLIANSIFNNKILINWINNLVHPIVKSDFNCWVKLQQAPFIIKEAAILIESKAYKQCNKIIVVTAPIDIRIKRVMKRDNMTLDDVQKRIKNQITDIERKKYANYTIINDGIKVVKEQVNTIFNSLLD